VSEEWAPDSSVAATFNSDPVDLGTLTADAEGVVEGTFQVPSVEAGVHTVVLEGTGADQEPRTLEVAFTITAASSTTTVPLTPPATPGGAATGGAGGPLAFTGTGARDLASIAVLVLAVGLHLLALQRRRATTFP
jgi:hypothetical protein